MRASAAITQLATAPTVEPITAAEAKEHMRVDGSDEDSLIALCLTTARERIEKEIRRGLIKQQWTAYITGDIGGCLPVELPKAPLMDAETFLLEYRDEDGVWTTWAAPNWMKQAHREPALLWITELPGDIDSPRSPQDAVWRATYWVGYGETAATVPGPIRHAVMLLCSHLFERREMVISGATITEIPKSLDWLLHPYRVPWEGAIQ